MAKFIQDGKKFQVVRTGTGNQCWIEQHDYYPCGEHFQDCQSCILSKFGNYSFIQRPSLGEYFRTLNTATSIRLGYYILLSDERRVE